MSNFVRDITRARCLTAVLLLVGCGQDDELGPLPPVAWEGEHLRVGTNLDLGVWSVGTLPYVDAFTGSMKQRLELPANLKVGYYLLDAHELEDLGACHDYLACVNNGRVFTPSLPDEHEIVHALQSRYDSMPFFFEEGGASLWGGVLGGSTDFTGLRVEQHVEDTWSGDAAVSSRKYALAAHFTAFLVSEYGFDHYLTLLRTSSRDQSRSSFEDAFDRALGVSVDASIVAYEALELDPSTCCQTWRSYPAACTDAPVAVSVGAEMRQFEQDLTLTNPEVIGPRASQDGEARLWVDTAVETDGTQHVFGVFRPPDGDSEALRIDVVPCSYGGMVRGDGVVVEGAAVAGTLEEWGSWTSLPTMPPGRYVVRLSRSVDSPGLVTFTWAATG